MAVIRRLRPFAAYLVFIAVIGGGLSVLMARQNRSRTEARRQTCDAIHRSFLALADVINNFVPPVRPVDPTLSPELQRLIAESQRNTQKALDRTQRRLSRPIPFCISAGVDTAVPVHGATPLPVQVTTTPGSSTTTTTTTTRGKALRHTSTIRPRGAARTPSTRPAAPGPGQPPTTRPPTTTTTRCRPDPVGVVFDGRCVP